MKKQIKKFVVKRGRNRVKHNNKPAEKSAPKLSKNLLNQIREKIKNATPPSFYWDYRDELTPQQVNCILVLPDGLQQVEDEICDQYIQDFYQMEYELVAEIVKKFLPEIQKELGEDSDCEELIDQYDLCSYCPEIDADISQLIRNSRSGLRIVVQFDLYQHYEGWQWKRKIRYEDVKDILKLLNINPRHVHKTFPYHGRRKGIPYVKPKDLKELWDEATYGGQYVMPVTINLHHYIDNRSHYHTGIILHKGAKLWLHDYSNGSGATGIPLQKNLLIKKADINYSFGDDRETAAYGMDETYGLYYTAWHNKISPLKQAQPTLQTLPSARDAVRCFSYYDSEETRKYIQSHFPTIAKRYLSNEANNIQQYGACRIGENIGQVYLTHARIIVDENTGEIVWYTISNSDRSYEILELIKEKLQRRFGQKQAA